MLLYQAVIAFLLSYFDSGLADYSLEVKVHSYTNPSHKAASGQCCYFWPFPLPGCISQCSNIFLFCRFNTTSQRARPDNCPLGMQSFEGNDNIVGLDYTLIFNGTSWPGYLNMSIQVSYIYQGIWYDELYDVDEFIIANVPITVGNNFTAVTAYIGVHQNGNISLSFRVTCNQNFSGPSCNTLCPGVGCDGGCTTRPCTNGGICKPMAATYRCVCPTGYTGQDCGTTMNTLKPCQNGSAYTSLPLGGYNCSCANSGINCNNNATDVTTYMCAPGSAGDLCTRPTTSSGDDTMKAVDSSQALAPVIAGVVVSLVVMVTLVAVGAIIIAGYIVHKRSKNHRVGLGTSCSDASHNPTYDQNAVGVVTSASPPLQAEVHNPIYSSAGVVDAKENTVHVCDYELPVMEYEVIKDCKEKEQNSTYATVGPEPVYYGV